MLDARAYLLALALGFVASYGCGDEGQCVGHCLEGEQAVWCSHGPQRMGICGPDQTTAALSCEASGGAWIPAVVCDSGNDEGSSTETTGTTGYPHTPWDPGRHVHFDEREGVFVIDQDFLEQLRDDPNPLYDDSTSLQQTDSGHYLVAAPGELSDALGWEPGDVLFSVDGRDLGGFAAFVEAYAELGENTTFELTLDRGGRDVVLFYRVE